MSLLNAGTIVEGDFITTSAGSADSGKAPKLDAAGRLDVSHTLNGFKPNAGETINGATLPVPVYQNKTDNEVYACDANDNTRYKFIGFAVTNSTNGNVITVKTSGIVEGFTGLSEGEKYYVQDAVGTIGTTAGTQEILVGIAISETALLIQKGRRFSNGVVTLTTNGVGTTVTLGFRPTAVRIEAAKGGESLSSGGWTHNGGNYCRYMAWSGGTGTDDVAGTTNSAFYVPDPDGSDPNYGNVSVTDTTFSLDYTENNSNTTIYWEAEGDL